MSVVILYGTETGNSELVADAIADVLAADHDPSVYDMSEYAVEDLDPQDFVVIVCATYGEGELPTGAEPFAEELDEVDPDLTGLRFAVFGLGDSIYVDTYNAGGKTIVKHLTGLGATQVGDRFEHDNSGTDDVDEKAVEWAEEIVGQI